MTISQKIFALMDIRHMTLKEFSEKTGISMSTIRDWKIKNTNPSSEKILKICQVLQIKPQVLLSEEEIDEAETVDEDGIKVDYDIIVNQDEKLLLEIYRKAILCILPSSATVLSRPSTYVELSFVSCLYFIM